MVLLPTERCKKIPFHGFRHVFICVGMGKRCVSKRNMAAAELASYFWTVTI